jgi:pimeloyl-ACP methyl ester carboxylesterase
VRAALPATEGTVERDGVALGYGVYGDGATTVLLLPTWTIIHARFWKLQVPYLARHYRVVVYDGPGNGRSDRVTDPARYGPHAYADDALAVLDACAVDRAVVVGLSLGAQYGICLAAGHPERVTGLVLVCPALPLVPPTPERKRIGERMFGPAPDEPAGWERYNVEYWHRDFEAFAAWFFEQAISERHSTKPREDAVRWSMDGGPAMLEADAHRPAFPSPGHGVFDGVRCPTLVIQGSDDRIIPYATGVTAASATGGALVTFDGSGHLPNLRDPVRFNLVLRDFVERVTR